MNNCPRHPDVLNIKCCEQNKTNMTVALLCGSVFLMFFSCSYPLSVLIHCNEPVLSAACQPSSAAGVEFGEEAVIDASSFNVRSP